MVAVWCRHEMNHAITRLHCRCYCRSHVFATFFALKFRGICWRVFVERDGPCASIGQVICRLFKFVGEILTILRFEFNAPRNRFLLRRTGGESAKMSGSLKQVVFNVFAEMFGTFNCAVRFAGPFQRLGLTNVNLFCAHGFSFAIAARTDFPQPIHRGLVSRSKM